MDSTTLVKHAPTLLNATASVFSAVGTYQQGKSVKRAAEFEARQLDEQAKAHFARGTQEAKIARRQGERAISDARAAMAASGGVSTDEQAIEQLAKLKTESDYNALAALYEAKSQAQGARRQAEARRFEGEQAASSARTRSLATVLKGAKDVFTAWPGATKPAQKAKSSSKGVWV